jgi:hypothetical protein
MDGGVVVVLLVVVVVFGMFAVLGGYVAKEKNRDPAEGAIIGGLFGPIGAVVVACLPTKDTPPAPRQWAVDYEEYDYKAAAAAKPEPREPGPLDAEVPAWVPSLVLIIGLGLVLGVLFWFGGK